MKIEEIKQLLEEVEELQKSDKENILYLNSVESLRLALLSMEKFEASKLDYHISFGRADWTDDILSFRRLNPFFEDLRYSDIIEHLVFALGGNCFFAVVKRLEFVKAIDELVNEVLENLGMNEEDVQKEIIEHHRRDIISDFQEFKTFVEKDGFLAFWENNKVKGNLKNCPEEIGKSQLMAFLTGRDTRYIAREVSAGKGFQDIIFVKDPETSVIIEIKIVTANNDKYKEGKFQLKDHITKNNYDEGYYLIFKTDNFYNGGSFVEDDVRIHQILINIVPEAPTKKFREKTTGD